ncbi:unnamed protein product [Pseudo-nitzschia multistriata]|uniref:Protein kinase domain-containing protein n=1 Tax=Pseudo-nitzschia multistriata TaxID=183589 RepID=A0A448ZRW5_9STRA|nr:unnamed protein product [Pseudo-nitzschia multistriata]
MTADELNNDISKNSNSSSNSSSHKKKNTSKQERRRRTMPSFQLYQKPENLTPQRCQRIVKYARKRLRGQDNNSTDSQDYTTMNHWATRVIPHHKIVLGDVLGRGAFSSVYAIQSIAGEEPAIEEEYEDDETDRMVVKFLRTKLYDNHGLFAASAADLVKEGNILSTLSHTNVIRLHAVASNYGVNSYLNGHHDSYFLVLERLECTLTDRLSRWQRRHRELFFASECESDATAQFVDASLLSSTRSANGKGWRKRLSLFRSSKNKTDPLFEDSARTATTQASSCDGSIHGSSEEDRNRDALAKSYLLEERVDVTLQLADALAYLHSKNVMHRDLKPDNIGFDADGILKVFDFDIARVVPTSKLREDDFCGEDDSEVFATSSCSLRPTKAEDEVFRMTQKVGSPRYMSPECANREAYNLKADVYSYALLAHQILTLQKPYDDITDEDHDEMVFCRGVRPFVPLGLPSRVRELLSNAWSPTISHRPTMEVVRSVLASERSDVLRLGTLERTSPAVPVANTTGYVWSCSFEPVSDNHRMLRKIRRATRKALQAKSASSGSGKPHRFSVFRSSGSTTGGSIDGTRSYHWSAIAA